MMLPKGTIKGEERVMNTKSDKHQLKRREAIFLRRKQMHYVQVKLCVVGSQERGK